MAFLRGTPNQKLSDFFLQVCPNITHFHWEWGDTSVDAGSTTWAMPDDTPGLTKSFPVWSSEGS